MRHNDGLNIYNPVIQTYFRNQDPPDATRGVRYAVMQGPSQVATLHSVQKAVKFNFSNLLIACELAANQKTQLISFPELFLSGYEMGSKEVVAATARYLCENNYFSEGGPISRVSRSLNIAIICPMPFLGSDPAGNYGVYDAALVFQNDGSLLGVQFKTHLWGTDEFEWFRSPIYDMTSADQAHNPYRNFDINGFPVGIAICYDAEFPEVARCLALNGALLTAVPTAAPKSVLPGQSEPYPDVALHSIPANAQQNLNFCSYSNRAGWEYRIEDSVETPVLEYTGNSVICDPYGTALVKALRNEDALLIADCIACDFPVTQPQNTHYIINRRPDLYKVLTMDTIPFPKGKSYTYTNVQGTPPKQADFNENSCYETKT